MSIWTNEDLNFLKENFNKYTKKELARILNKSDNAIQIKANRLGLKREEKYHYDKTYFKNILTSNQAYWIGFMYADGYVTSNKNKTKYTVGIELSKDDYKHLIKFNKCISGNVPVTYRVRNGHRITDHYISKTEICMIRLFCTEMAKDLILHGCCENKSLIKKEPIGISDDLMRDFIRGYFDGNGSISYSYNKNVNKSYLKVTIETGSEDYANWISNYLNAIGYKNTYYKDKFAYKIQMHSKSNIDFLKYIYENSEVYLDRKYEKYLSAVYGENNTNSHKLLGGKIGKGSTANTEVSNRI